MAPLENLKIMYNANRNLVGTAVEHEKLKGAAVELETWINLKLNQELSVKKDKPK